VRLDFERGVDPSTPLTVRAAVDRGHAMVNRPVGIIMGVMMAVGVLLVFVFDKEAIGGVLVVAAPFVAWIWWSYAVPRWRSWALGRGVDPEELQAVAQREKLVWRRGHLFEKTEFPYKPS
jgi:hypothetical protein